MNPLEPDARKAMLARLAGDISVLARAPEMQWTCCDQSFDHQNTFGRTEHWLWRFCTGEAPGTWPRRPCGHWHHRHEYPPMAVAGERIGT